MINIPLLDPVMHLQLRTELLTHGNILPDAHTLRPLPALTRAIEHIPSLAEVVVEVVHVLGHAVVDAEIMLAEFGEGWLGGCCWCGGCGGERRVCCRHVAYDAPLCCWLLGCQSPANCGAGESTS